MPDSAAISKIPEDKTIYGLSIVVIARNEEIPLKICLNSLSNIPMSACEIICVDSASTDGTLDLMKDFAGRTESARVVSLTGTVNASIARNTGLKLCCKNIVLFLDGDIELNGEFLREAKELIDNGQADAVTGSLDEILYLSAFKKIDKGPYPRRRYSQSEQVSNSGGSFMCSRKAIEAVGQWNIDMVRGQDFEYTLRLVRSNKLLAIPVLLGTHHTLPYHSRPFSSFLKFTPLLTGYLIRSNIDQPRKLSGVFRNYLVGFAWWFVFLVAGLTDYFSKLNGDLLCAFLLVSVAIDSCVALVKRKNIVNILFAHYLDPPMIFLGMFYHVRVDSGDTIEKIVV